jgi:hypothetical protein
VTLYVTPVIYTYLDALSSRLGKKKKETAPAPTPGGGAREYPAAAS